MIFLSPFGGDREGLFLVDSSTSRVLAVIKKPAYWNTSYDRMWIDSPNFWREGLIEECFYHPIPNAVIEFKGKIYIQLDLTEDGFRKWRGVDKLTDSHDITIPQGKEEEE